MFVMNLCQCAGASVGADIATDVCARARASAHLMKQMRAGQLQRSLVNKELVLTHETRGFVFKLDNGTVPRRYMNTIVAECLQSVAHR